MTPQTAALQSLRERMRAEKSELLQGLAVQGGSTRGVMQVLRRLARITDRALLELWKRAEFGPRFALLAVGGYGRGELYPYSDVDVLLLLPDDASPDDDPALRERIERFIGSCWDAGLEIGSSVRSRADCLREAAADVTVQTAMLECRLITGPRHVFSTLVDELQHALDPRAFFRAKTLELRQRHQKFENTPYALEPNCKESPGGLRDLQVILWVARAAGLGNSWDELADRGLATPLEASQLKANEALLSLVRLRLHLLSQRREDRLVFDMQTAVAESFGHRPRPVGLSVTRPSEDLMRRYYWAAKAVVQLNQILLLNIEERLPSDDASGQRAVPQAINERFLDKAGLLEVASDDTYVQQPQAILETFLLFQSVPGIKGLSARTLRALYNARPLMSAAFRADPVNRATFMAILQQPRGITHAMRLMNETSVLGRYLWVFRRIVGQMQHDLFHVYTVDQHILMVLRNVRRFFMVEHAHEYPYCAQLAAEWDKPWVLFVAALFHDIAKGRGGDHSELGEHDVRVFCRQHAVAREDADLIAFLVREHLTMSRVAQKEDLSDPEVVQRFAQRMGSERRLTALYLLTVADVRGTSPKVWNNWKAMLLQDLYRYALRVLGGRAPDTQAAIDATKREALTLLALHSVPHESHKALWSTLDVGYFLRHQADEIAWHTRNITRHLALQARAHASEAHPGENHPASVVRARLSPAGEGLQVLVFAQDQDDLFARICGFFDGSGFSILDARVHTTRDGYALDTFQVIAPTLEAHYRELIVMVETGLSVAVDAKGALPRPSKGRLSRRVRSFPIKPRVDLRPDEKAQRWLLSVSASDRAGLLYRIARVMAEHRISLSLAKISTLGERVEDTFVVSGAKLQHNRGQIAFETELLAALEES